MGVKFVRELENEKRHHLLQLPKEFKIDFISVPDEFIGRSIKEVNIRAKYNITILAIKQKLSQFGQSSEMPNPGRVFREADILVVAGKENEVEDFKALHR